MNSKVTTELKAQIFEDYNNPAIKVKDMEKKYKLNGSTIADVVEEMGGQLRTKRKTKTEIKKCVNCHRKIELDGAKFCPYCGADIRTEKELALEALTRIFSNGNHLPIEICKKQEEDIKLIENYIRSTK